MAKLKHGIEFHEHANSTGADLLDDAQGPVICEAGVRG